MALPTQALCRQRQERVSQSPASAIRRCNGMRTALDPVAQMYSTVPYHVVARVTGVPLAVDTVNPNTGAVSWHHCPSGWQDLSAYRDYSREQLEGGVLLYCTSD